MSATEYDYIVIGSGAGGGPLAANLVNAGFRVLLLEAGGDACASSDRGRLMYEVPIFHGLSTEYAACQWDYFVRHYSVDAQQRRDSKFVGTDPANGDKQVNGIWYPRAGTLGGCTAHNAMITVTPQSADWDHIAELTGDPSWSAAQMNRYFVRLENCRYRAQPGSAAYVANGLLWSAFAWIARQPGWRDWAHGHGFGGWLTTSEADPRLVSGDWKIVLLLWQAVLRSLLAGLGKPWVALLGKFDPNDLRQSMDMREGIAFTPLAVADGKRNGPREFLLRTQSKHPDRLTIQLHSLATKILFEGQRAVGVEYRQGEHLYEADPTARCGTAARPYQTRRVRVLREVIVAAGAFNSPQLLKLSGVGPADELQRFGIPVVADLPGVGENLQDRYEVGVVSEFAAPFKLLDGATFAPPTGEEPGDPFFASWEKGRGLYTTNGILLGILKRSKKRLREPDLYIFGLPGFFTGYKPGYSRLFERHRNRFTWAVLKAYTTNRAGRVTLRSADPMQWPCIEFKYFGEGSGDTQADVDAVVDGIQFVRRMNRHLNEVEEICPGPKYDTPAKLRAFVEQEAWGHHASCSNRIGADGDTMAVLDSRFRVRKTEGLRVVDASVFPRIPGYFIVSAIYMISEKAADVILEDAARSQR